MTTMLARLFAVALLVTGAACDDALSPEERVAGRYEASTLMITEGGATFDALQLGVDLEVTLHENGTTSGLFFVPQGEDDGSDFSADLTGAWTLSEDGQRVSFTHASDTFIRDREFFVQGDRLVSNEDGINVVLTKD